MRVVSCQSELESLIPRLMASPTLGFDIETTGLDPYTSDIRLIQLAIGQDIYVVDCYSLNPESIIRAIGEYSGIVVGHNLKFEAKFLKRQYSVDIPKIFDTYRASAILYNGRIKGHNLYQVMKRELGLEPPTADMGESDWSGSLSQEQLEYAASDVVHLNTLRDSLRRKLIQNGLVSIAKLEFEAIVPEAEMELTGMPLDMGMWLQLAEHNSREACILQQQLQDTFPGVLVPPKKSRRKKTNQLDMFPEPEPPPVYEPINLDSPKQVLAGFAQLGLDVAATNRMALARHAGTPVIDRFLQYKEYSKRANAFGTSWQEHLHSVTGRIHTNYFPFTGAGRYSSSDPNLQQLPREKAYRACFRPINGHVFVVCDYSAIELRLAAEVANDTNMIDVFARSQDPHMQTARIMLGKEDVSKSDRQAAKAVNFGMIYGIGAEKLVRYAKSSYGVDMPLGEAEAIRERFFEHYSGFADWHKSVKKAVRNDHYQAKTILGRGRMLYPKTKVDPETGEEKTIYPFTNAVNSPVQGSGADGLKQALRCTYNAIKGTDMKLVHCVHDEIILEVPIDRADQAKHLLQQSMVAGMSNILRKVPCVAEASIAKDWSEK